MALLTSSKIITDGLVFYYDAANSRKSFIGAPTTNLITNGHFANGLNAEPQGGHNPLNEIVKFPNPGNSEWVLRQTAVGGNLYTEYEMTVSGLLPNTTYCMSCWYFFSPDWDGDRTIYHSRFMSTSGAHTAIGGGVGVPFETRIVNGNTWVRSYQTLTTPTDASGAGYWFIGYPSQNTKGYRYITNIQLEQGTTPTYWSNGARSNTQAIRDLTGNATITANNLNYNMSGFSFNGANSNLALTNFNNRPVGSATFESWIYPTRALSTGTIRGAAISSSSSFYIGIFDSLDGGATYSLHFALQTSGGRPGSGSGKIPRNTWSHIVGTYDGTTVRGYINGVEVWSNALTGSVTDGNYYVGAYANSLNDGTHNFEGQIGSALIYNRSLSASEILQNFNLTRRKYGV